MLYGRIFKLLDFNRNQKKYISISIVSHIGGGGMQHTVVSQPFELCVVFVTRFSLRLFSF